MVFVGESTGTIDTSLAKIREYFDRKLPGKAKRIFSIFKPLVIILLAGIVLTIFLSKFIPLYSVMRKISGR